MLTRKRTCACVVAWACGALDASVAFAADTKPAPAPAAAGAGAASKPAPTPGAGKAAPAEPVKPTAPVVAPKPKPRPRPVVPAAAPALAKPTVPAPATDEAVRLRRVEAALRGAGLLPSQKQARDQELAALTQQLAKLDEQRTNLEGAVRLGLDAESVKPALGALEKKSAELRQRIAVLESESRSEAEQTAPSELPGRLAALEAAVAQLQQTTPAASPTPAPTRALEPSTMAAPPPAASEPQALGRAGWKDGFFIESSDGAYSLKPSAYLDFKLAYAGLAGADDEFAFSIPYARLSFKGTLFTKALKYNFTTDFAKGNAQLTYYFGDYTVLPDYFAVRVGQQKRPFSRLYIGPSEKGQFVSPSVVVKSFGDATDLGLVLHNGQPRFEYSVGLFNGTTSKSVFSGVAQVDPASGEGEVTSGAFSNVPSRFQPALVARVALNHGKLEGYSESDFEAGGLRASLGAASYAGFDLDNDDKSALRGTLDGLIKYEGLAVNMAGFIGSKQAGRLFRQRELEAVGFSGQAGYLVTPHLEPVARYGYLSRNSERQDTHEMTVGLNVYFYKHALKLQNDVTLAVQSAEETTRDYLYESQLQLMF